MNNKDLDMIIRLALQDDDIRNQLKEIGNISDETFKKIDAALEEPNKKLLLVDKAVGDLKDSTQEFTDRGPRAIRVLGRMGVVGLAAAASILALVTALRAMNNAGQEAIDYFADIGRQADDAGVSLNEFTSLRFGLTEMGANLDDIAPALSNVTRELDLTAQGSSALTRRLGATNPQLVQAIQNAGSLEQRLEILRTAYQSSGSEAERQIILISAFGEEGARAGEKLLSSQKSIPQVMEEARRAGVTFGEDTSRTVEQAADKVEAANQRIEAANARMKANFVGVTAGMKNAWADFISFFGDIGPAENATQELDRIVRKREGLLERLEFERRFPEANAASIRVLEIRIEKLRDEEAALRAVADAEKSRRLEFSSFQADIDVLFNGPSLQDGDLAFLDRIQSDIRTLEERKAAELEQLDRVRGQLTEAQYQRARELITLRYQDRDAIRAQADAERERERRRIEAQREFDSVLAEVSRDIDRDQAAQAREQAAATRTLNRAYEQILTPLEQYRLETEALAQARKVGIIDEEKYNAILLARIDGLNALKQAETEAAERDRFGGETLGEARTRILDSLKTAEQVRAERLAAERAIVDALVSSGQLSPDQAAERMRRYREELDRTKGSASALDQIWRGQIRTLEDLGEAILRYLVDTLRRTTQESEGLENLGQRFLGNLRDGLPGQNPAFTPGIVANDNAQNSAIALEALTDAAQKTAAGLGEDLTPGVIEASLKTALDTNATTTQTVARQREIVQLNRATEALKAFTRSVNDAGGDDSGSGLGGLLGIASSFFGDGDSPSLGSAHSSTADILSSFSASRAPGASSVKAADIASNIVTLSQSAGANVNVKVVRADGIDISTREETDAAGSQVLVVEARKLARGEAAKFMADGGADRVMSGRFNARPAPVAR